MPPDLKRMFVDPRTTRTILQSTRGMTYYDPAALAGLYVWSH